MVGATAEIVSPATYTPAVTRINGFMPNRSAADPTMGIVPIIASASTGERPSVQRQVPEIDQDGRHHRGDDQEVDGAHRLPEQQPDHEPAVPAAEDLPPRRGLLGGRLHRPSVSRWRPETVVDS